MSSFVFKRGQVLANAEHGPYSITADGDVTTATATNGLSVSIGFNMAKDHRVFENQMSEGVPVWLGEQLVAHLVQTSRGTSRHSRAMHVRPVQADGPVPEGLFFRLRGIRDVSLESDAGKVLTSVEMTIVSRLRIHQPAEQAVIALFAVVSSSFFKPLHQSGVFPFTEKN